jgi:hypothetical protein
LIWALAPEVPPPGIDEVQIVRAGIFDSKIRAGPEKIEHKTSNKIHNGLPIRGGKNWRNVCEQAYGVVSAGA